jgi:hypothetical protein
MRHMQTRSFLTLLLVTALVACGGGGSETGVPARIEIAPSAVLLTTPGQTKALQVRVFDADGERLDMAVQWSSSNPDQVPVNAQGVLTAAGAGGSSQIVARIGELRSPPLLAVHTTVPAEAVLVSDTNILSQPVDTDPVATTSLANTYRVRLGGMAAPAVGSLLVSTEGEAVAGRVQSVVSVNGEHEVTLALVPLAELFPTLQIEQVFDLNQAVVDIPAALQDQYTIGREGNTYTFTPKPGRFKIASSSETVEAAISARARPQVATPLGTAALPPFGKCEGTWTGKDEEAPLPVGLSVPPVFKVTLNNRLDVLYTPATGLERFVVRGEPNVAIEGGLKAIVAFEGKVACNAELLVIRIPVGGPLSFFIGGLMPVGVGVELGGKVTLASLGITAKAEVKTTVDVGIACPGGSNCALVSQFGKLDTAFTPTLDAPGLQDLRLEPSLATYGFVKASIGNPFLKKLRFDAFTVKAGVVLKGSFSPQVTQIADAAYKSDYKLASELKAGAGAELAGAAALLGLKDLAAAALEVSAEIATSPAGTVEADKSDFLAGEVVNFTVKLDPGKVDFLPVIGPYNVKRIVLVRKTLDFAPQTVASIEAQSMQTEFRMPVTVGEAGKAHEFFAFIVTNLVPFDALSLELGQASATTSAPPLRGTFQYGLTKNETIISEVNSTEVLTQVTLSASVEQRPPSGSLSLVSAGVSFSVSRITTSTTPIERLPCKWDAVTKTEALTSGVINSNDPGRVGFSLTGEVWRLSSVDVGLVAQTTTTRRRTAENAQGDCSGSDLSSSITTDTSLPRNLIFDEPLFILRSSPPFQGTLVVDAQGRRTVNFSDSRNETLSENNGHVLTQSVAISLQLSDGVSR